MNRRIWTVTAACIAFALCGPAFGATVSGRLTTSAYTWQSQNFDGSDETHLRFYQGLRLNANRLGNAAVSLHLYAQVSGDPLNEVSGRDNFRIYHAYLKWKPRGRLGLKLQAGRQRIFAGVGYGTVDGVKGEVKPHPYLTLSGYAGVLVPLLAEDGIGTWNEGHLFGGRASVHVRETALAVSYADRAREPAAYTRPGSYTGLRIVRPGEQFRRLGLDLRQGLDDKADLFGRVDVDLEEDELYELEIGATIRPSAELELSGAYQQRKPTILLNSVLSVFEASEDKEASGRMAYQVGPNVRLTADVARVAYDDDTSWRAGGGVTVGNVYLGYNRRIGYGGQNDAVTVSALHPLTPELTLRASGSVAGYRVYESAADRDRAVAGSLGIGYRPRRTASIDAEAQFLNNKYYGRDLRLFVRGSVWFFKRSR